MTPTLTLATASFARWRPSWGVPVTTAVATPTWFKHPLADGRVLAPFGLLDADDWRDRYRARLDRRVASIDRELFELAACYPGVPLVLLCYERDIADCHRGIASAFLANRYGIEVPEL